MALRCPAKPSRDAHRRKSLMTGENVMQANQMLIKRENSKNTGFFSDLKSTQMCT